MNLKHLPILFAVAANTLTTLGQQALTPTEASLLRTLIRDTTSTLTAYLPPAYRFGLEPLPDGRLILVKNGPFTRLLLEGTHRVYTIDTSNRQPRLTRIDATLFQGDNHNPIALRRKDTLMQYGGKGRFTQRDFFIRYREANRDWERYPNHGRNLQNAWTPYQYDPASDALFLIGSRDIDHGDLSTAVRDSVFRFDFPTRQWTSLGKRSDSLPLHPFEQDIAHQTVTTPIGTLIRIGPDLLLIDIPGNRWRQIPSGQWIHPAHTTDTYPSPDLLLLPIGDSLHEFLTTPQGPVHRRHPFSLQPWQSGRAQAIYLPTPDTPTASIAVWGPLTALALTASTLLWKRRRRPPPTATPDIDPSPAGRPIDTSNPDTAPLDPEPPPRTRIDLPQPGRPERMAAFLKQGRSRLPETEWQLLIRLIESAAEGCPLDTASVNTALGVARKDAALQKSRRNSVISRINRLYAQTADSDKPLVQLERDAIDKRTFRYGIREEWHSDLLTAWMRFKGGM